jgi:hypothetical protein
MVTPRGFRADNHLRRISASPEPAGRLVDISCDFEALGKALATARRSRSNIIIESWDENPDEVVDNLNLAREYALTIGVPFRSRWW